jgi:hypothetical protein
MMRSSLTRRPQSRVAVQGLVAVCLLSVSTLGAATAAAAPAAAIAAGTAPAWQQKLDATLKAAATAAPDVLQPVLVRTAADVRKAKVEALARWGFAIEAERHQDGILIAASARDAMVLAEDPEIAGLSAPFAGRQPAQPAGR